MDSEVLIKWSIKLAENTAPDETDLAPFIAEAFIRGGKEKESLFPRKKGMELGAFGVSEVGIIFPFILQSIADNSNFVNRILSTKVPLKRIMDIINRWKNKKLSSSSTQNVELLQDDLYLDVMKALEIFADEMSKSGLSKEQCERIAYRTLLRLLDDPSSSIQFVKAVSKIKK
jgi:hypothetical protein